MIERVISEEHGFDAINQELKQALVEAIGRLGALSTDELLSHRYEKFRRIGGVQA